MTHEHQARPQTFGLTRLSDEQWELVRPVLDAYDPPRRLGRRRIASRQALEAVLHKLRSRCPWNALPKEYPDDSTVHRAYQRWRQLGVLDQVLNILEASE